MTGIIQILADDQGYGDLACYGHADILSPHIDALADAGIRYTNFCVASPVCSTSRAAFMTGLGPQRLGMHYVDEPETGARHWIPAHTPTVASRLRRVGWSTGHFGKCHVGEPPQTLRFPRFGYDKFFGFLGGRPNAPYSGHSRPTDCHWIEDDGAPTVVAGYTTDLVFARALAWIAERVTAGGDWYCEIWPHATHTPLWTSIPERDQYSAQEYTSAQRTYYGAVTNLDGWVGALVAQLTAAGTLDDTFIFFSSDNGPEPTGEGTAAPWGGCKTSLKMGGVGVPAILTGPGVSAGQTDTRGRWALDWMATCLAIASYDTSGIVGGMQGVDLRTAAPADRYLCWEYHGEKRSGQGIGALEWSILKADSESKWKLMRTAANGAGDRLYTLATDPTEATDVGGANTTIRDELKTALTSWHSALPAAGAHTYAAKSPANEAEAVAVEAEPTIWTRLIRCVDTNDRTSKVALLNKLLGLPRTAPCQHGHAGRSETGYVAGSSTHPTLSSPTLIVGAELFTAAQHSTNRARCTAGELATLDEMLSEAGAVPVP